DSVRADPRRRRPHLARPVQLVLASPRGQQSGPVVEHDRRRNTTTTPLTALDARRPHLRCFSPEQRVPLDNTAEVETPEHVRFRYRVAGPVRRMLAYLIDLLIRGGVLLVLGLVIAIALGGTQAVTGVLLICTFILEWGYYVFFETIGDGRSPG